MHKLSLSYSDCSFDVVLTFVVSIVTSSMVVDVTAEISEITCNESGFWSVMLDTDAAVEVPFCPFRLC